MAGEYVRVGSGSITHSEHGIDCDVTHKSVLLSPIPPSSRLTHSLLGFPVAHTTPPSPSSLAAMQRYTLR